MRGTEKQIKWAQDIIETVSEIMKDAEEANANHPQISAIKKMHETILNNMKNASASNIIEDFRYIQHTKDMNYDYKSMTSMLKMADHVYKRNYRA